MEKKGVPVRIEIGPKDVAKGNSVLVRRDTGEKTIVPIDSIDKSVADLLDDIQTNLYNKAFNYQKTKTKTVDRWDDFVKSIDDGYFVLAHWSGEADVKNANTKSKGKPFKIGMEMEMSIQKLWDQGENEVIGYKFKPV